MVTKHSDRGPWHDGTYHEVAARWIRNVALKRGRPDWSLSSPSPIATVQTKELIESELLEARITDPSTFLLHPDLEVMIRRCSARPPSTVALSSVRELTCLLALMLQTKDLDTVLMACMSLSVLETTLGLDERSVASYAKFCLICHAAALASDGHQVAHDAYKHNYDSFYQLSRGRSDFFGQMNTEGSDVEYSSVAIPQIRKVLDRLLELLRNHRDEISAASA